jgi:nucleoside-diphosphate-sugar epimerase
VNETPIRPEWDDPREGWDVISHDAARICHAVDFAPLEGADLLITGASGLVGTYFTACAVRLRQVGRLGRVVIQTRRDPPRYLRDLTVKSGIEHIVADLSGCADYERIPEVDCVVHAAGYAQPGIFTADPVSALLVNTFATAALLSKVREGGRFLFLSSSEVYAGLTTPPFAERDAGRSGPDHPRSGYIEGKRGGEAICHAFCHRSSIRARVARLGMTYGPGTRPHDQRVINRFIEMAFSNGRIELADSGTATRTMCYVADAVEMMWKIFLAGREVLYNVGGSQSWTVADLARRVGDLTGATVVLPDRPSTLAGAPLDVRLDLTRLVNEFGPPPVTDLDTGLKRTIEWQRGFYPSTSGTANQTDPS